MKAARKKAGDIGVEMVKTEATIWNVMAEVRAMVSTVGLKDMRNVGEKMAKKVSVAMVLKTFKNKKEPEIL